MTSIKQAQNSYNRSPETSIKHYTATKCNTKCYMDCLSIEKKVYERCLRSHILKMSMCLHHESLHTTLKPFLQVQWQNTH